VKISKGFKFILLAVCLFSGAYFGAVVFNEDTEKLPPFLFPNPATNPTPPPPATQTNGSTSTPQTLPKTFLLKVPFTSQAPTANWDELHNEACEEASAIMAYKYFDGDERANLPAGEVEAELAKLVEWEKNNLGYYLDINTEETVRMLKEHYKLNAKIVTDYSENSLKEELVMGNVILWPANGQMLGNPNFRAPGPPYHMVVVKGYDQGGFITNDPGTRKGLNYPYSYNTLYAANGDFNHQTHSVDLNKKMVIVVWK